MQLFALANANASTIAVTGTATALKTLIDTAGAATHTYPAGLDAVDLVVEDGDIRVIYDNNTPTASKGFLLKQGTMLFIRHIPIDSIKLIRTGGSNVAVSVQIGRADSTETTSGGGSSGGGSSSITSLIPGVTATSLGKAEDAAHASGDTGVMALGVANEAQSNISGTDGDYTPLATNRKGNSYVEETKAPNYEDQTNNVAAIAIKVLAGSTYAPSEYSSLASVTKANIKASSGNMLSLYATNSNASVRYLQLHKTATTPSGGAVPAWSIPIPPASSGTPGVNGWDTDDFTAMGINGSSGWAWAISTTQNTFTDSATAADHSIFGTYK